MSLEERIIKILGWSIKATAYKPYLDQLLALIEIEKARGYNEGYNKAASDYNAKIDKLLEDNNANSKDDNWKEV